jgi:hypothetical protein
MTPGILWIRPQANTADARTEYVVGYRNTTSAIAWFRNESDAKLFVKARHENTNQKEKARTE